MSTNTMDMVSVVVQEEADCHTFFIRSWPIKAFTRHEAAELYVSKLHEDLDRDCLPSDIDIRRWKIEQVSLDICTEQRTEMSAEEAVKVIWHEVEWLRMANKHDRADRLSNAGRRLNEIAAVLATASRVLKRGGSADD